MKDKLKTFAYKLLNFLYDIPYCFFCIFPIKKKRIFVYGFLNHSWGDHPKYILNELIKKYKDYEIYWVTNAASPVKQKYVTYVRPNTLKAFYYQATSKIWIATVRMPLFAIKRKDQIYIQTWHGAVNIKKIEKECLSSLTERYVLMAKHDSSMIDYLVCANEDKVRLFKKYFWYNGDNLLRIGSPRNDILINVSGQLINDLKNKFGLSDKNIILYAPTFRIDHSIDIYKLDFRRIINSVQSRFNGEWCIVVRLHPTMSKYASEIIDYSDSIIDGSNIDDVQELLAISNILITDYSSIIFDFVDTKRPAFIYAPDIDEYRKERDFHIRLEDTPFSISKTQEELAESILHFDSQKYAHALDEFSNRIGIYDNGKASGFVANLIEKITVK